MVKYNHFMDMVWKINLIGWCTMPWHQLYACIPSHGSSLEHGHLVSQRNDKLNFDGENNGVAPRTNEDD
jgi:hypothetical protein